MASTGARTSTTSRKASTSTRLKRITGTAAAALLSIVCSASCGANAFVLTPRVPPRSSGTTTAVRSSAAVSSMSIDMDGKKTGVGNGGGGPAALAAFATKGASSGASAASAAADAGAGAASTFSSSALQQSTPTIVAVVDDVDRGDSASLRAFGPPASYPGQAEQAAARTLPGTWWTTGLPKWMEIVRRRMLTKEDWLHLHAASGAIYLVGGSLFLLSVMGLELFTGVPQLDTTGALPLCILGAGLVNALSSFPMASTRSWVLQGISVSVMQLWFAWYASGAYPACLQSADPWIAAAGLSVLVICSVEAEEQIQADRRARELLAQSGHRQTGKIMMRGEDYVQGDAINRYGALANLIFNGPHLYATLMGSGWLDRLAEAYPAAPALLFHSYFSLAASSSLALLAPTLYQRRLIDANGFLAMQFLVTAPVIMGLIDAAVMGSAATNNPIEIYLGFLH